MGLGWVGVGLGLGLGWVGVGLGLGLGWGWVGVWLGLGWGWVGLGLGDDLVTSLGRWTSGCLGGNREAKSMYVPHPPMAIRNTAIRNRVSQSGSRQFEKVKNLSTTNKKSECLDRPKNFLLRRGGYQY